jgi:serine/threonine-protein kinase
VYDFGYAEGRLFIVMEYVPGETLRQIIDARAPLPPEEALSLMVQACAGLGYVHRLGLVHCDVKPQNFLVTPDGRLKVTDFGISRAWAGTQEAEPTDAPVVWGSPQYFSPEQAAGKPPLPASDVYALGVVLYEMLTRRLPFLADDPQELARLHREAPPVPPRTYVPNLSPALEEVLLKVLSKEPSARYRTADQFGRVLLRLAETPSPAAKGNAAGGASSSSAPTAAATPKVPQPHATRPRDPLAVDWLTLALALLALLAVGGLIPLWVWVYLAYHGPR